MKRKVWSLLLAVILVLGMLPGVQVVVKAEAETVHVIVRNTTFTEGEDYENVPWEGTLIDTNVELAADSTAFSCIKKAVENAGYSFTATASGYITEVNGLTAGDADMFNMDGWVFTLNGWFADNYATAFSVANGELAAGDEIILMYTCTMSDVGMAFGPEEINFALQSLSFNTGSLSPAFDAATTSYTLTVPTACTGVTVSAKAADPNIKVVTSVGDTTYKRTETVPVTEGTEIKVAVGGTFYDADNNYSAYDRYTVYTVTIAKPTAYQLTDVGAQWSDFRNSATNMAITSASTPADKAHTKLKWATEKLSSGWTVAPGPQLIVGDSLIVASGTSIYKYDLATGNRTASGTLPAGNGYGYTSMTYVPEKGILYVPLEGGTIAAIDPTTLSVLWTFKDALGGQALSPLTYNDGCIYGGFWTGEAKNANFVCIDAATGELNWTYTVQGGFYWAGAAAVGDYVVVGTDDGASGTNGTSHVFVFSKTGSAPVSSLELTGMGDQRSCMAVSGGRVYFTTKKGYLCSAAIDASTGALSDLKSVNYGAQSTSTPVVYGDYVYFATGSGISETGSSGNMVIAKKSDLTMVKAIGLKGYPQSSLLLSTAYEASEGYLYFYSTYNAQPGGVTLIKVKASDPTDVVKEEIYDAAGYEQYCISSIICDTNGDLYYKNDSGCVLALTKTVTAVPTITADLSTAEVKFQPDDTADALTVTATTADAGTLTYRWQSSTDGTTFTDISGATGTSYTPATAVLGTTYYRCVVTNTLGGASESATSKAAKVTVKVFSSDAGLKVVTTTSNSISAGTQAVAEIDNTFKFENYSYTKRIWLGAAEANATITAVELQSYTDVNTNFVSASGTYQGTAYKYRFYKTNYTGTSIFKVTVLAEDGVTEGVHYVVITSDESYTQASSDVTVTVSNAGTVVVPMKTVTVIDRNYDGAFDMDEVLYATHEAYYEGGAAAGYASGVTQYGLSLTKLWGDTSGAFGYYLDDVSCWSLADTVIAGQSVYAYIYADQTYWSDSYAFFANDSYTGDTNEGVTVLLNKNGYDASWNVVTSPMASAVIKAYDEAHQTEVDASSYIVKDNNDGTYTLFFKNAGTYMVEASLADKSITPALTLITVSYVPVDYKFTSGMNQRVEQGKDAEFVTDGDFDKFVELQLDGKTVDPANYTARRGSTYITLKKEFIETLSAGTHRLTAVYEDCTCSTTFTVAEKKAAETVKDQTTTSSTTQVLGAEVSVRPYILLMAAAAVMIAALSAVLVWRKRKEQ